MDIPSTVLIWQSNSYFFSCSCRSIPPFLDLTHCLGFLLLFGCSLIFTDPLFSIGLYVSVFLRPPYAAFISSHVISDLTIIQGSTLNQNQSLISPKCLSLDKNHVPTGPNLSTSCVYSELTLLHPNWERLNDGPPKMSTSLTPRTFYYVTSSGKGDYTGVIWLRILGLPRWAQCSQKGAYEKVAEETV